MMTWPKSQNNTGERLNVTLDTMLQEIYVTNLANKLKSMNFIIIIVHCTEPAMYVFLTQNFRDLGKCTLFGAQHGFR